MNLLNQLSLVFAKTVYVKKTSAHVITTFIGIFVLNLFAAVNASDDLLSSIADPENDTKNPLLIIPMGSYLEHFNIGNIYLKNENIYLKILSDGKNIKTGVGLHFKPTRSVPTSESCWAQGYDLSKGNDMDLYCNTDIHKASGKEDAAQFLYSSLVPFGSYLQSCTGVLQTRENDRVYLYASCTADKISHYVHLEFIPDKLDITDCKSEIVNHYGSLACGDTPVKPRHILSGSYLESCELSRSYYEPDTQKLHSVCGDREIHHLTLNNADSCIGKGKDIAFINKELVCQDSLSNEVRQHTASKYVPAGSYLTTCTRISFYPCMASDGRGLLSAKCASQKQSGHFIEASLTDSNNICSMSSLGYVSNIEGRLVCDSEIKFNNEDPTQGLDLLPHFQCDSVEYDGWFPWWWAKSVIFQ